MATYLVCKTFSSTEIISWEGVTYTLGTDAFNDIVTAELVASQDSPDLENEIIVFAGNYTSSLNNFQNYEGITLNVTGVKYHGDDANKATVTLKTFKNSGIATFANAAFNATSVINNAGKTITLNGATFTAAEGVANAGTFKVTNNSTVNAEFTGAGTVSLSGRILNSSMTGSQAFVTATNTAFYGDTTLGGEGSTLNVKAGTWLMIADTGILNLDAVTGSGYLLVQKATDDNLATLKNSTINGTVYFAKDSKLVGANTITAFTTKSNATGVTLGDDTNAASLTATSVVLQSGSTLDMTNFATLTADSVSGTGLINVDATKFAGGVVKVINLSQDTALKNVTVNTGDTGAKVAYGDDGDVVIHNIDQTSLYVNAAWAGSQIGTEVGGEGSGKYYGINAFGAMADAAKVAPVGTASTITVSGAAEIVAASSFGGGQDVTITGEASFYWGKDWMYVNRGATQGDVTQLAKVTFKDATITRTIHTPNNGDRSIHIGGAEKDSTTKGYGQVDFDNSTVETEWVINKNVLNVKNNSELTVSGYLNVAGRPAKETPTGEDHTAVLNVNSSTVDVLGNIKIGNEGKGEINLTNGAELKAGEIIAEKSVINVTNSTLSVTGAFSNAGTVNVTGVSKISAAEYTGDLTLGKLGETTTVITTDGLKATSGNVLIADGGTVAMNGNGFDLKYVRDSKVRDNDEEHVGYTLNIGNADLFKAYALYINGASVINVDNVKDIESWYFNIYGGTLNLNGTDKTAFKAGVKDNGNITGSLNVTKTTLDLATLNVHAAPAEKHAGEVKATGAVIDVRFTNIGTTIVEDKKYAAGTSQTASLELDGSTLIVKNIGGEPILGSITVGGDEATAGTLTMKNGSAVVQKFTDSEASHYRSAQFVVGKNGSVDIDKSSVTMDIVSNAGTIDVAGKGVIDAKTLTNNGLVSIDGSSVSATTVTNNGSFTVSGTSTINIGTLSGNAIEVAAGSTIKDSTVGGNLTWEEGTVTFKGENFISRFVDYDKVVVGKGDSLTLTGSRPTLGYGREINVTGDIEGKATETDKTTVTKSFETTNGFSLYGTGTGTLNVTNAYFVSGGSGITLKPKNDPDEPGSLGTYTLTFTNSIADIKYLKMNETGNDITATVTFDASVLNHDNNITNADPGSTMTFKNGSVANATSSFKNGGVFQVLSGSKFTANGVIQYGENSGNDGAITVDGKDSVMTLVNSSTGHAFKSVEGASITVTNGGVFSANYVTNEGTITIDTASLLTGTALDNTNGTITIDATKLAPESYAKVIDLTQASALTGVKVLGDAHAIYGADGDVVVTNISAETLYVNSAWTINPDTEKAYEFGDVVGEGMVFGINAFSDIATMVSGITSVTNKIKFLEGGTYNLNWKAATISQSMTFETDGKKPTIWHGEFNLGTENGTGDTETYALNNDIYFFQFATNKYSPAVLTINAELSIAQGIWFKAGTKTTVTEKGSIQRIDQFPWGEGPAELHAGQFEVYGELTVNGTVNYFTQGATAYTFRIGNADKETYTGVLNVDGGNVHFMNNDHVDGNHPAFAPSLIDENGTVKLTNGGKLTVDHPLTNKGAITIDATSLLTGTTLDNSTGTITIDARNLAADSYVKVIDLNQTSALTGVSVVGDARAIYGADGDVVVTNITATDLYVNSAWTGYGIGDPIEGETGKYYGINAFDTLAGASGAAAPSETPVAINIAGDLGGKATFNYGQNVVITGTSDFNWQEGWLYIGRGDNGLPKNTDGATVTFKNATIKPQEGTSAPSMGFNVSCAKAGSDNVNDGILNIEDSTIDTDYMYDCNKVNISNSKVTALNLRILGREGSGSRTGKDVVAVMNITKGSKVNVLEYNGQTHGAEGGGALNITDSEFSLDDTATFKIEAKGLINLNGNATFTANGGINNLGAINMEVLPKAEAEVLTETESTETEEEVAFNKFTAKSISNSGTIDAKVGSTITTESGSFTNKTGAEVTVLGDSENLASTVIDAKKGISNSGSFSVTNATINVDGDALANTTNGVLTITNSIVNVGASYAFNSWAGSTTLFATTVNATINVFGGSFTIGEGASTLNGGFSGTAKLADGAVLKDSTVKKAYGAADIGTFTIATGASVGISGKNTLSAAITNNGTITIDATSSLSATSIAGGTIELTNFADNATRPVITVNGDFTADVVWTYGGKDYTLDGTTRYTDDNKFLVQKTYSEGKTTISVVNVSGGQSTLLVDAEWAGVADGTPVEGYDGNDYVIGFNAFGDFKSALAVAQTNKGATIDFGTASYVWAQALNNDKYKADITTAGAYTLTNGDGFLLNYEVEIDTAEQTTFTIDDAFITLTKLTARKNTDITISDSRVDFNWFEGGSAYLSAYKGSTLTISNSMVGFDPYDNKDKAKTPEGLSPAGTGPTAYWHWGPRVVVYGETEITDSTMYIYVGQADNTGFDVLGNSDTTVSGSSISLARLNVGDHYAKKYLAEGDDENDLNASLEISNSTLVNTQYRGDDNGKPLNGIVVGSASNAGVKGALTVTDESLVDFTVLTYGGDAREVGLQVNNSGSTVTVSEDSTMILPKITNAGSITVDSGSTLTATGLISNSGSIEVKAGSTLSTTSTANPALNNQGTLTVNGSTVEAARAVNTGTMTIENGAKFYASILLENTTGGTITFNGATLAKKADSTDATSFSNWAGITQFNNGSTVNANIAVHNGQVVVDASTVNGNVNVIAGSFTVGGASTLNVGALSGTINVLDGATLTAVITDAAEASSVVFDGKTTGITLAEGAVIKTVAENYGKVSAAADLQVKTLFNGASDGSVKGTITAATLTADSIVNNNGAAKKGGSSIELTGDLVAAGDILNGAAPIVPGTDEPADKAFITAANITAGSITNYGTVGSQAEGKELATITLNASTGTLTNGLYGNVFATTLNAASIVNEGGIVVENINITSTDGVINNKAGGKIAQDNVPMTIAAKEIKNAGEISTHGGAITATAITNNAYNADTNDGLIWTDSITADGTVTNYGKIDVDGALTANRVVNSAGEFTVNGESKIVAVSGVANSGNVVVSGGKVTFNGDVTAKNLNAQNASATININNATTVSVAEKVYYYGTIVATNSVLDGIEFSDGGSGTGTLKVVNSSIDGIKLNGGTMQLDTMSLENVTVDGAFDVVGNSDFSGVNEVEGLTVSEGANLTISAAATITSLTQPSLTVTADNLVNNGTITIDADGLVWGSTLKQLKVVSVTGEGKKAINSGTITVKNAEDTMAIVQDDGIYLYYVKSSGETKTLFVNSAWSYAPGYEFDYDGQPLVFGMNAFQDADDIVFYANTDALVFVGGNTTPYADLVWNKDDVSVTIDGGLEAKFSDIKLGSATLTGDISADDLTFTGDTTVSGKIFANKLTVEKTLAMDWDNPIVAATLTAGAKSITIDVSEGLQNVVTDTAVITTSGEAINFASIVDNYDEDIYVTDGLATTGTKLSLSAKAIGKVSKGIDENPDAGLYNSISKAVSNANTKLILIVSGDFGNASLKGKRTQVLTSGTVGNYYFAGGCNVATEPLNPESPYAFLYEDYKQFEGSTNVTIENGQFSTAIVIGADLVQLASNESSVTFYHIGDSNLTINGGHFEAAKNSSTGGYGERAIAGGMYYNIASGKTGEARLFGNVNLTITGGEFIGYNVYGGNFVNGTKVLCNRTHIKGNITLTLDATTNELNFTANEGGFGGIVQAGSFGQSNVTGNTEVILTGDQGITFESLVGGSTSDDHILKNGKWTCESYVTGTRTLTFSGFTGDLDFSKVSDFTTVAFEGANEVNFEGEFHRYFNDDVTNWVFEEGASLGGTVNFDFTGDSVDVLGSLELYKSNVTGFDIANVTYDTTKLAFEETATSYLFTTIA